jgi:hypothetical protein
MFGVNSTLLFCKGGKRLPEAFVMINTEIGAEADVLKNLKKIEGVEEANAAYGYMT